MLVLSRRVGESICIGDVLVVTIAHMGPDWVELAFSFTPLPRVLLPEQSDIPADQEMVTRRKNEGVRIGGEIEIIVVELRGDKVRLGIHTPPGMPIHRSEVNPP